MERPFFPIIYVRGYAMSQAEKDETTADPFCGFNLGSTVFRATSDRKQPPRKFVFESPVIRLGSDFKYQDVFEDGLDIVDPGWIEPIPSRSIVIYRYYEGDSTLLGSGGSTEIGGYAKGLSRLVARLRQLVCADPKNDTEEADFKCYLVAHSMGGLVCRAFLQNPTLDPDQTRGCVDKFFTYATPHNGIEMAGINVPPWLSASDMNNFNRGVMEEYLALPAIREKKERVDWLPESRFPSRKVFCMIGTNRGDYEVAKGLSRTFAGNGSDGLVRIDNASLYGIDESGELTAPAAKAFAYRAHSGYFGIVNSEESYQNLIRFLFGDVRVDVWLDIESVALPTQVQQKRAEGKTIRALYQFEVLISPKGLPWYLTRRTAEEDSVACRTYDQLTSGASSGNHDRSVLLSTVFLGNRWRINPKKRTLTYSVTLGIRTPDYEVDRSLWFDDHFEGGYLFRDTLRVELTEPRRQNAWRVSCRWASSGNQVEAEIRSEPQSERETVVSVPFYNGTQPNVRGRLRFLVSSWNAEA